MKKTAFILLFTILTISAAAQAIDGRKPFILRAGQALHTTDPTGCPPGGDIVVGLDYLGEHFMGGVGAFLSESSIPMTTAELKAGIHGGNDRVGLSIYLTGKYRWNDDRSCPMLGSGVIVDVRLSGPFGLFIGGEFDHPFISYDYYGTGYEHTYLSRYGQCNLVFGLTFRI